MQAKAAIVAEVERLRWRIWNGSTTRAATAASVTRRRSVRDRNASRITLLKSPMSAKCQPPAAFRAPVGEHRGGVQVPGPAG